MWFTSDTHFGHANVIKYSNRPFDDVEEMNESLIKTWNDRVSEKDIIYHLGDFSFLGEKETMNILRRLNGHKHLILGNHDDSRWDWKYFESVNYYKEVKHDKKKIILMHYPIESWNGAHRGSWHLHGHCHGNLDNGLNTRIDVGVDCFRYAPVSFEEISKLMEKRAFIAVDHHETNKALKKAKRKTNF